MPSMLLLAIHLFLIGIASRLFLESHVRIPMNAGVFLILGGVVMLYVQSLVALIWFTILTFVMVENQRLEPSRWVNGLMRLSVTNRAVCYAGKISYSTYLIHYPIFHIAMLCWPGTQDATRPEMLAFLWSMLPLVLLASAVTYRVIEQPFMQIGRRRPVPGPLQAL
jgi:peptidoglycan/LPS O-acetylase OafA/YrhL